MFLDPTMAVVYTETTTVIVLRPYPEVVRVIRDELAQRLVVIHIKIACHGHVMILAVVIQESTTVKVLHATFDCEFSYISCE